MTDLEWQTAKQVCTDKQIAALDYWRHGYGYKRISILLGIPRDTARGRIERGREAIKRALVSSDPPRYHPNREAA